MKQNRFTKSFILGLFACSVCLSSQADDRDPLVRDYITPQRIVWQQTDGKLEDAEALLQPGTGQAEMASGRYCHITTKGNTSLILDFGREIHGGLQIVAAYGSKMCTSMRIRFGESIGEACSESTDNSDCDYGLSTNDHSQRDFTTSVSRYGSREVGNSGFRFVRIDFIDKEASLGLQEVRAVYRHRDLPYVGSFHCSDPRLDSIWQTAAYTVHLNMQEYLWDGIKRDRCIWLGDMHPEVSTIMAVFSDKEVVEKTLDHAVEQFPLPHWLNGMSSYSFWYLIIQQHWFMHHGDEAFLKKHKDYIAGLIRQIDSRIDAEGNEVMDPGNNRITARFLDWPSSPNRKGVEAGYRALMSWALNCGEYLCRYLGDEQTADIAQSARQRLDANRHDPNGLLQAAAIMSLAGTMDAPTAAQYILGKREYGFTTFYGYYMLEALALNGNHQDALDIMRTYWGAMLDLGATTFWEDFHMEWLTNARRIDDPSFLTEETPTKTDVHGANGDYCYKGFRHSLCHGWSGGPCAWLAQEVLGIHIVEPGCRKVRITPHLGDLQFAEGTYPTPYGVIHVKHTRDANGKIQSKIRLPKGVKRVK